MLNRIYQFSVLLFHFSTLKFRVVWATEFQFHLSTNVVIDFVPSEYLIQKGTKTVITIMEFFREDIGSLTKITKTFFGKALWWINC